MHIDNCTGNYSIFVDMSTMNLFYIDTKEKIMKLFPIYVDQNGTGPKKSEISEEFNLSNEKLKLTIKNYISKDFHFK